MKATFEVRLYRNRKAFKEKEAGQEWVGLVSQYEAARVAAYAVMGLSSKMASGEGWALAECRSADQSWVQVLCRGDA